MLTLRFWGTRGSIPSPGPATAGYGGNTPCLEVGAGGRWFIFDALTASDRPYKKALPSQRALGILDMEGKSGQLDSAVVDVLLESQIYRKVLDQDWRQL